MTCAVNSTCIPHPSSCRDPVETEKSSTKLIVRSASWSNCIFLNLAPVIYFEQREKGISVKHSCFFELLYCLSWQSVSLSNYMLHLHLCVKLWRQEIQQVLGLCCFLEDMLPPGNFHLTYCKASLLALLGIMVWSIRVWKWEFNPLHIITSLMVSPQAYNDKHFDCNEVACIQFRNPELCSSIIRFYFWFSLVWLVWVGLGWIFFLHFILVAQCKHSFLARHEIYSDGKHYAFWQGVLQLALLHTCSLALKINYSFCFLVIFSW